MSAEAEARRLKVIGLAVMLSLAVLFGFIVLDPFGGRAGNRIAVVMDVPYLGQGVVAGTAMMLHGVNVGEVTGVSRLPSGIVRLAAELEAKPAANLTDALNIDFRPANYFGVTGVNLIPEAGGRVLRDGTHIDTVPRGNFTLPTLLSRLGELTGDVVTPQLIQVIDRATRYTDGLNPLIETMVTTAKAVAKVQTVSTEQLLRNTTGVSVAFPSFMDAVSNAGDDMVFNACMLTFNVHCAGEVPGLLPLPGADGLVGQDISEDFWQDRSKTTLDYLSQKFFAAVGKLETSHIDDLLPAVDMIKTLTDVVPGLITPDNVQSTLVELRTRLEKMYAGSPDQRALQVQIVLDNLPGVAAPLGAMGGP